MPTLAARAHRNLCDFNRWLARLYGGRLLDRDGVLAVTAATDWPPVRTAVRTSEDVDAVKFADAAEAFLFADGHTACVYARVDADDDLTKVLTQRGFAELSSLPEMVREATIEPRPDPTDFRVRLATTADDVYAYAAVAGEAFAHLAIPAEMLEPILAQPDVLLADEVAIAVAEGDGGAIVAGAMSILVGDEPNGYVAWVACADAARGHGLGDAVTRRVTNEGFARGAHLLTLEASPFGRNTYARMGYRALYDYRLLIKV